MSYFIFVWGAFLGCVEGKWQRKVVWEKFGEGEKRGRAEQRGKGRQRRSAAFWPGSAEAKSPGETKAIAGSAYSGLRTARRTVIYPSLPNFTQFYRAITAQQCHTNQARQPLVTKMGRDETMGRDDKTRWGVVFRNPLAVLLGWLIPPQLSAC